MNDNQIDDFFKFDFSEFDKEEPLWDKLIDEIIAGNVIPVIGPEMLIDSPVDLHSLLIRGTAHKCGLQYVPGSFSELLYDKDVSKEISKYNLYMSLLKGFSLKRFRPSPALVDLLSIKQFPFVITTSFTPVVEQTMNDIWHDELSVMRFNNNPKENDDIRSDADLRKPSVYYMFGRLGEGVDKFVLTDSDMLKFCASWLSEDRPKNLCNKLRDKYLLMLGNNYSDWLFRFIWYSMRKDNMGRGMLASESLDESLINFMTRNAAFTKKDPAAVVRQIQSRLAKKLEQYENDKFKKPEENIDIFISYSRSDSEAAEALYSELTKLGKRVWYDRYNLTSGGAFMDEIHKAIRTAKYFVPVLSANIEREKRDPHVYRNEWDWAMEVAVSMGRTYIIPLTVGDFEFYGSSVPDRMQRHNAISCPAIDDMPEAAMKIVHAINKE